MQMHLSDLADGAELAVDVCVVGAGAAGQTVAKPLADRGREVLLLESGGLDFDPAIQELNRGFTDGLPYYELQRARLRFFGGTTAIWGGRTCRLDPIDFERRSWVPHSGWPFGPEVLAPYYEQAEARLDLVSDHVARHVLDRVAGAPPLDRAVQDAGYWQFDHHIDRFTAEYRRDILDHPRITVLTCATVTEVVAAPDGREVERLDVANLEGRRITVRARVYVLACGGIENARLLLASRSRVTAGLGNGSDMVGRTFMDHVHCRGGEVIADDPLRVLSFGKSFRHRGRRFAAAFRPGEPLQRSEETLNVSFTVNVRKPAGKPLGAFVRGFNYMRHSMAAPNRAWRKAWYAIKLSGAAMQERVDPYRPWLLTKISDRRIYTVVRCEQAPNPESRITLDADSRDALGKPRVRLHWAVTPLEKHSVRVAMGAFDSELRRLGLGRLEPSPWLQDPNLDWVFDPLISKNSIAGYHHMGTTRMSTDPATGVVDADGKVHGIANLYVAGSSVFPTCGWANPTLTILALSLRLADHLASRPAAWSP